jgi:hypothetical protein
VTSARHRYATLAAFSLLFAACSDSLSVADPTEPDGAPSDPVVDASLDVAVDASVDVEPVADATGDGSVDVSAEVSIDAAADAVLDAAVDASHDVVTPDAVVADATPRPDAVADATSTGPQILSFGTSVSQLTTGQSVTLLAIVSTPGGVQNLAGGEVTSVDGSKRLGLFTATTPGSFSFTASFEQLQKGLGVEFVHETELVLRAVFFSSDGQRTVRDLSLRLHCDGISAEPTKRGACGGNACGVIDSNKNCGSCGAVCSRTTACEYLDGKPWCIDNSRRNRARVYRGENSSCDQICVGAGRCLRARVDALFSSTLNSNHHRWPEHAWRATCAEKTAPISAELVACTDLALQLRFSDESTSNIGKAHGYGCGPKDVGQRMQFEPAHAKLDCWCGVEPTKG